MTHAEDNKSSESCEIIQKTIESPQDRRSELSNHLFLRNQTEQTQKQQIVANFDLQEGDEEREEDYDDFEMAFPDKYHSEEVLSRLAVI